MKYIYTHLGLGDHIICNGLVRSLINLNEEYSLFVKSHNRKTVEFMYRDLSNMNFIEGDDAFVNQYIKENNIPSENLIIAGFHNHPNSKSFDESFYLQNNLPISTKWENFYVERDNILEKKLFEQFNVKENEYVFIHDDISRGYVIDENLVVNKDLKIIRPIQGLTDNVFDYCYLMEHSFESHFIDSSFRLIFDGMKLRNTNIFYHIKMLNGSRRNNWDWFDARCNFLNFTVYE
jgi:hypothetical protein